MICPNCGKENKDNSKFCSGCGIGLLGIEAVETTDRIVDPEDEKTMVMTDIENEETEVLYDAYAFENEETVILDDMPDALENEETVILNDFENEETVILEDKDMNKPDSDGEKVPDFNYYGHVPVFKEDVSGTYHDTAYIDHLRALKQLWDDGIITEDEFTRKKQQILGI